MGSNACKPKIMFTDGEEAPDEFHEPGSAPKHSGTEARVLIVCIDYDDDPPGPNGEVSHLDSCKDGDNMVVLCQKCGVTDYTFVRNNDATRERVTKEIQTITGRCEPGDFFVFFYSGHGMSLKDDDGDEDDGFDEAFCLVTPQGVSDEKSAMRDDEFAAIVSRCVPDGVYFICIADCCHSASICDFNKECWQGIKGVCFSGCADYQCSINLENFGGNLTHSLLMSISDFSQKDEQYSCAQLYNAILQHDDEEFKSKEADQDMALCYTPGTGGAGYIAWPLLPLERYTAPMFKNKLKAIKSEGLKMTVDKITRKPSGYASSPVGMIM